MLLEFYDEITGNIIIPPKNRMTGKVNIIAIGSEDLTSNIIINNHSNLQSRISVYSDEVIEDITYPPRFGNQRRAHLTIPYRSNLISNIFITPINRMAGIVDIIPPPRKTLELEPIKDAFIRSQAVTFNYGSEQSMVVGYSQEFDEVCRSLIGFDISDLPDDIVIEKAELKLYNSIKKPLVHQVGIFELESNWEELGVTWQNQPQFGSLIDLRDIGTKEEYVTFDVTESITRWYNGLAPNNGFIIKAINENAKQYEQFPTRENRFNKPILQITYYDKTIYSFGRSDIPSSVFIYSVGHKEIVGSLSIREFEQSSNIPARIHIYNPDYMESSLVVSRPDIISKIIIRQSETYDLISNLIVRRKDGNNVDSNILINAPDRIGKLYVLHRNDLNSQITIKVFGENTINSKISVNRNKVTSNLIVRRNESNDIQGKIHIKANGENKLNSGIIINARDRIGKLYVLHRKDIVGNIFVIGNEYKQINSNISITRKNLICNLKIVVHSQLQGSLTVKRSDDNIIESNISIPHRKDITGWINVVGASMIPANLFVLSGYLKANIKIPSYETYDKLGKMTVRVTWANEIPCSIFVGGDNIEGGYVLII